MHQLPLLCDISPSVLDAINQLLSIGIGILCELCQSHSLNYFVLFLLSKQHEVQVSVKT